MKLLYLSSTPEAERRLLSVEWTQWLCAEKQNVAVTVSQQDPTFSKGGRASCHSTTMESWCHFNWTTQGRDPSVPVSELIFACETQYQKLRVFWHLQRCRILRSGVRGHVWWGPWCSLSHWGIKARRMRDRGNKRRLSLVITNSGLW